MDLSLLVLKGNVSCKNVTILDAFGHVFVSCSMIKDESSDELSFSAEFMLHVHDFDHEQVNRLILNLDDLNGINNKRNHVVGHLGMKLSCQSCSSDIHQNCLIGFLVMDFEGI